MNRSTQPCAGALRALAFAGVLVSTVALASPPTHQADTEALPSYEQLDTNHDGIVTSPEIVVTHPVLRVQGVRSALADLSADSLMLDMGK